MANLRTVDSPHPLYGKTVLLRIDTDVDIENGKVLDDTRLVSAIPTIKFLLKKGADLNIVGHLGRPLDGNSKFEIRNSKFTLEPVAEWLEKKLKRQNSRLAGRQAKLKTVEIGNFKGWKITSRINLIENIRFFRGEEDNPSTASGQAFARELALLGDIYVNDAFAVCHREHVSIVGVTKFLPSYAGLHLKKEVEELSKILNNPARPLAVLIGGAKIETKLPLVSKMHRVADYVLVGGEIAEQDRVLIKVQHEKTSGNKSMVFVADMVESSLDITPKSVENFKQVLGQAGTIVWNGPVGLISPPSQKSTLRLRSGREVKSQKLEDTERGTRELAHFIVSTRAYKVVGGGDTISYLRRIKLLDKFDFVSTGGGAMLEFLSGHKLPGLEALEK
jgi:phosphoglycerate kinase